MHALIPSYTTYMDHDKARELAERLNADDDEWTYRARELHDFSVVEVYDEDGNLLGNL